MDTVSEVARLRHQVAGWRREGALVGFVPTMGALHAGHLSLVRIARERAAAGSTGGRVVASIFVNPTQFGPQEDLARYPRAPERDAALLAEAGCDLLFLPAVETIYPPGHATFVEPGGAARGLEGDVRPGHFRGVATVVTQLFQLVQPDLAVFGEKDAQQLAVVRQLVRDLHVPVEIVAGPTVRESDGLAMSSRNAYLSPDERRRAPDLSRTLFAARGRALHGETDPRLLEVDVLRQLEAAGLEAEYVEAVDALTMARAERIAPGVALAAAVRLGKTRLIDNVLLVDPEEATG